MNGDGRRGMSLIVESIFRNAGEAFSQPRDCATLVALLQNLGELVKAAARTIVRNYILCMSYIVTTF